jgi:glycosyltransferase involved in cell wall biosynthesis
MNFEINALCLIKNEDDIISQTLNHALLYCHKIFVIDNGSTDSTWDIVKTLASENQRIVPYTQTFSPYCRGLRKIPFLELCAGIPQDSWWLVLDADEFLAEDPNLVIQQAMREGANLIRTWQIQFYFTEIDFLNCEKGIDNRKTPIIHRRRYYEINWQEKRLFRNIEGLIWKDHNNTPTNLGRPCSRLIMNRHYPYRDPEQIMKRLDTKPKKSSVNGQPDPNAWKSLIKDSRALKYHAEGSSWSFSLSGISHYYGKSLLRRFKKKLGQL